VGLHSSALNIVFKYSVWVIDCLLIKSAISAAEVIYSTDCDTRVVIIRGYLRGWKEVVVADFRVLSSLGSLR
jgi:predicted nucleic acid-binding protein